MERKVIAEHLRKKRKVVIATVVLLLVAFLENYYLNCTLSYSFLGCELGWIYVILALIVIIVACIYRK